MGDIGLPIPRISLRPVSSFGVVCVFLIQLSIKSWRSRYGEKQFDLAAVAGVDSINGVKIGEWDSEPKTLISAFGLEIKFDDGLAMEHVQSELQACAFAIANRMHDHHCLRFTHEAKVDRVGWQFLV